MVLRRAQAAGRRDQRQGCFLEGRSGDQIVNFQFLSLSTFVILGVLGIFLAGGFLDNSIFELGTFGKLLSAGAIPLIYIFIGLKVGSELSSIVGTLNETQKEK